MFLKSINGRNFRNFKAINLDLPPGQTYIVGKNGTGKTNLLEMIYCVSTFGSFRTSRDGDMLSFGEDYFTVSGMYGDDEIKMKYSDKKEVFYNEVKQDSLRKCYGEIPVVALTPDDLELITGAPSKRRRFMDEIISFYRKSYMDSLSDYSRAKKQRNTLLKRAKDGKNIDGIEIWEKKLADTAPSIVDERRLFINKLRDNAVPVFENLSGDNLRLKYIEGGSYDRLLNQYRKLRDKEIERGYTIFGPHRDDLKFTVNGHPAEISASFGIKRLLTVALRISTARIIEKERGKEAIILIDEVLGELDNDNVNTLNRFLDKPGQVIIATTREELIGDKNVNIYMVENNNGTPVVRKSSEKVRTI